MAVIESGQVASFIVMGCLVMYMVGFILTFMPGMLEYGGYFCYLMSWIGMILAFSFVWEKKAEDMKKTDDQPMLYSDLAISLALVTSLILYLLIFIASRFEEEPIFNIYEYPNFPKWLNLMVFITLSSCMLSWTAKM